MQLVMPWCQDMHKASATKDAGRKGEHRTTRKEDGVWGFVKEDRGGHTINKVAGSKNGIAPKPVGHMMVNEKSASRLNQVAILTLSHPILLRAVGTRGLMKDAMCREKGRKWGG